MSEHNTHTAVQADSEHINVMVWAGLWLSEAHGYPLSWPILNDRYSVEGIARLTEDTADAVGQMLVDANTRAVNEDTGRDDIYIYSYREPVHRTWSQIEILKAIQFYEHQNHCSHEWHVAQAHYFCQNLRARMVRQMPGWSGAPWHITPATLPAAVHLH